MNQKIDAIQRYFYLVENFTTDLSAYQDVLHPEMEQVEFPNLVTKSTRYNSLADLGTGMAAGKKLLRRQEFAIQKSFDCPPDACVIEQIWTGEIGAEIGPFKVGQELKAYICTIFEFKDGKIFRQRNYDCYEPF